MQSFSNGKYNLPVDEILCQCNVATVGERGHFEVSVYQYRQGNGPYVIISDYCLFVRALLTSKLYSTNCAYMLSILKGYRYHVQYDKTLPKRGGQRISDFFVKLPRAKLDCFSILM